MDDAWEVQYFGGYHRDGLGDADADGLTDRDEFKAGTVPVERIWTRRIGKLWQGTLNRLGMAG